MSPAIKHYLGEEDRFRESLATSKGGKDRSSETRADTSTDAQVAIEAIAEHMAEHQRMMLVCLLYWAVLIGDREVSARMSALVEARPISEWNE